jgi:hypothetical protein
MIDKLLLLPTGQTNFLLQFIDCLVLSPLLHEYKAAKELVK